MRYDATHVYEFIDVRVLMIRNLVCWVSIVVLERNIKLIGLLFVIDMIVLCYLGVKREF